LIECQNRNKHITKQLVFRNFLYIYTVMKAPTSFFIYLLMLLLHQNSFGQQAIKITANQVIEHYFEAVGGKEKAKQIKSISLEAIGMLKEHTIFLEKKLLLPNKSYATLHHKDHLISKNVYDGKKGKVFEAGEYRKLTKNELLELSGKRSIFPEFNYLDKATYIGIRDVNTVKCHLLKIGNTEVYYDLNSGLKVKGSSLRMKGTTKFTQHLYFENYVAIEGIKMPSKLTIEVGKRKIEFQIKKLLINQKVSTKDFK